MKTTVVLTALAFVTIQCTVSRQASSSDDTPFGHYWDLAQVLRFEPGLSVSGLDWNVNIRLSRSSEQGVHYIVNGQDLGDSYLAATQSFTMDRVQAIRVIRSLSDRGSNGLAYPQGAIEIWTR